MKKSKKLVLNKETVRSLTEGQVRDAAGQAIDPSLQYSRCPDRSCGIACTYISCRPCNVE